MSAAQTYIVTGGNRGIGLDICRKLVGEGHNVILCSRSLSAGREACEHIRSSSTVSSGSCQASQLDVSNPSSIQSFVSAIGDSHSKQVYGLINNAAIYPSGWTQSVFDTAMSTNFNGPMDLIFGLAPHMQQGGRVVNVTSSLANLSHLQNSYRDSVKRAESLDQLREIRFTTSSPNSFKPTYSLTKAMINKATQILAKLPELQHLSINSADPGWVRTDMGGASAPRSVEQGSGSILATLRLPAHVTGGNFFEGRPQQL